jgi:hypothetical protein
MTIKPPRDISPGGPEVQGQPGRRRQGTRDSPVGVGGGRLRPGRPGDRRGRGAVRGRPGTMEADVMATDESDRARDSLWVTGQGSPGSRHSSREAAMTAPGSLPALADDEPDQPGPQVDDRNYDGRQLEHGGEPHAGAAG